MTGALLVDTDVIIEFFRGNRNIRNFFINIFKKDNKACFSVITKAEIYAGIRPGEEEQIESFFFKLEEIPVDGSIAKQAGILKNRYGSSHHLLLPDAFIAATAMVNQLTLCTNNIKHFKLSEITVRKP